MRRWMVVSALVSSLVLTGCGAAQVPGAAAPQVPQGQEDPAPGWAPEPGAAPAAGEEEPGGSGSGGSPDAGHPDPGAPGPAAGGGSSGPGGPSAVPGGGPGQGPQTVPADNPTPRRRQHVDVRGIYMTGWTAGSDRFYELVDFMLAKGLNAVVIDIKDDDGRISWDVEVPLAREIGASANKIRDIDERIRYLKERNIYVIGRLVVYADPLLGSKRPDLAIHHPDGTPFVDRRGIRWPDPYNRQVWEYNVAIAKAAAAVGFDEIQFDYIRFPEHRIAGYNYEVPVRQRADAILGFLKYAKEELAPYGVFVAADVFGLTTSVAPGDDMEIGQIYEEIAGVVDYICPMVYPSHYAPGTYGIANPNADPGRIVYESMVRAQKRTWGMPVEKHRPWIQDFDVGKDYTAADVEAQIRGLAEAGIYQWLLWDPKNRYTRDANYDVAPPENGEPEWRRQYRAELAAQAAEEGAGKDSPAAGNGQALAGTGSAGASAPKGGTRAAEGSPPPAGAAPAATGASPGGGMAPAGPQSGAGGGPGRGDR